MIYPESVNGMGVAATVREKVLASRDCFWRPEDFSGGSPGAVTHALGRLVEGGELNHLRRGLYWRGTPTLLGMAPPPASRLASELAPFPGCGPAGLSAAHMLGLTTQLPRREIVAVPTRAPADMAGLHFVSRAAATRRAPLRPAEIAVLEVLRDWDTVVECPNGEATSRIAGLVGSGEIRPDMVASASTAEPAPVRERLRGLLGDIGRPELAATVPPARS